MQDQKGKSTVNTHSVPALENMHSLFLEALRHREQEIFRYLAILGPALGGFLWLLQSDANEKIFIVGTISVIFLLLLGGVYSLALGYNYRYITLQLAKLEAILKIKHCMLVGWPRSRKDFIQRYKLLRCIPWCTPPEIIWVFWLAFLFGIIGVTGTVYFFKPELLVVFLFGIISIFLGFLFPVYFGWKFQNQCKAEPENWGAEE